MFDYDYVIVGAGLAGGIIARKLAEEKGKKILILERRNHIAGNTYDFVDESGIKIQKYGPHVLHTNSDEVYSFISKYCTPIDYRTKCEAVIDGISTPSPFNFKTIDQFYSVADATELKKKLAEYYCGRGTVTIVELLDSEDEDISGFARFLFEKDYRLYTAKQWGIDPEKIDVSVLKRVPVVLSYGDTYFYDKYEFMPKNGFENMYQNLISHKNISVQLNTDALKHIVVDNNNKRILYDGIVTNIIYTGAIDELFSYKYGILPYRSLFFKYMHLEKKDFQPVAIVAYPQVEDYTRVTEYTKMPYQDVGQQTCVAYEYPMEYDKNSNTGNEPYYPVLTDNSKAIYNMYKKYSEMFHNLTLCGRLADFKYYNMDQVILRALDIYSELEEKDGTEI